MVYSDGLTNSKGIPLSFYRERDEKLNRLLTSAEEVLERADGTKKSRSETDFYVVNRLYDLGFSKGSVWTILRECRPYEKTMRGDYIEKTITKVFG